MDLFLQALSATGELNSAATSNPNQPPNQQQQPPSNQQQNQQNNQQNAMAALDFSAILGFQMHQLQHPRTRFNSNNNKGNSNKQRTRTCPGCSMLWRKKCHHDADPGPSTSSAQAQQAQQQAQHLTQQQQQFQQTQQQQQQQPQNPLFQPNLAAAAAAKLQQQQQQQQLLLQQQRLQQQHAQAAPVIQDKFNAILAKVPKDKLPLAEGLIARLKVTFVLWRVVGPSEEVGREDGSKQANAQLVEGELIMLTEKVEQTNQHPTIRGSSENSYGCSSSSRRSFSTPIQPATPGAAMQFQQPPPIQLHVHQQPPPIQLQGPPQQQQQQQQNLSQDDKKGKKKKEGDDSNSKFDIGKEFDVTMGIDVRREEEDLLATSSLPSHLRNRHVPANPTGQDRSRLQSLVDMNYLRNLVDTIANKSQPGDAPLKITPQSLEYMSHALTQRLTTFLTKTIRTAKHRAGGSGKKRKKKDGAGGGKKDVSETVKVKSTNSTALKAVGGKKGMKAWMTEGGAASASAAGEDGGPKKRARKTKGEDEGGMGNMDYSDLKDVGSFESDGKKITLARTMNVKEMCRVTLKDCVHVLEQETHMRTSALMQKWSSGFLDVN
ncbi:hypothetical protein BCR33DRAFT_767646 [Rhizoclosmatium globosum]|uniref:Transcription initiation factor TFIID subunit 4 n=1 Tax=Rhizoclosmatium globosum TaxID=329046 RepID=A0A1Y2C396_9FUNG|nr:hypothetical protein BCR33DRAFT_767646 [Rhizoclosmatium globosum]|eukprot:ORY41364.1 hypothetical protein BCR33DRAFT_767646 [Rhizoclosmatium globosum]